MVTRYSTEPRRFILVLGPKSAGKTTFVNALSGEQRPLDHPQNLEVNPIPSYGINLVDTTGLGEGSLDENVLNGIEEWMISVPSRDTILALLYFFDISSCPLDYDEAISNFSKVKELCKGQGAGIMALVSN